MEIISAVLGLLGNGVKGFFGFKEAQSQAVTGALDVLGKVETADGQHDAAVATIISSEASSGYWLAACIRPLCLLNILILIDLFFMGWAPAVLLSPDPMPPMVAALFNLLLVGFGGYTGARTIEKVANSLQLGSILKTYVSKKLI